MALRIVNVPVPQQASSTILAEPQTSENYDELSVRDLLSQAQELYRVKNPATRRIKLLKDSILQKLNVRRSADSGQMLLFNMLDGLAFEDENDNKTVIVSHPDVPMRLVVKYGEVTNWRNVLMAINDEIARLRAINGSSTEITRINALEWVLDRVEEHNATRVTSRFVPLTDHQHDVQ